MTVWQRRQGFHFRALRQSLQDKPQWKKLLLLTTGLVMVGGSFVIYATAPEDRLFALDSRTGRVKWSVTELRRSHHIPYVAGDRVIVSQSNYDSDPLGFGGEPTVPKMSGSRCLQQGWGLTAYAAKSGQQLWQFCPNATQFPNLDLKLTHGMQLQLTANRVYLPLLMQESSQQRVSDRLLSLDAATGQPLWSLEQNFRQSLPFDRSSSIRNGNIQSTPTQVSGEGFGASVVPAQDRVVVLTGKLNTPMTLQAFDTTTAKQAWTAKLPDALVAEAVSLGPMIRNYLLTNDRQIFAVSPIAGITALNPETGAVLFHIKGEFWGHTVVTQTAIYQFGPTAIAAYDAITGQLRWRQPISAQPSTKTYSLPGAVDGPTLYTRIYRLPEDDTKGQIEVLALNTQDGKPRWRQYLEHPGMLDIAVNPVTSAGGVALVAANPQTPDQTDLQLVTLDAQSGKVRWTFPLRIAGDQQAVVRVYGLMSSDPERIYIRDRAPRFRHWLAHLNSSWH
ncbi:MAG TPA: PQQ-binding-like beta-propeller repeat protein [Allocoleopsis sp.]